jgi:hypothetical protein
LQVVAYHTAQRDDDVPVLVNDVADPVLPRPPLHTQQPSVR